MSFHAVLIFSFKPRNGETGTDPTKNNTGARYLNKKIGIHHVDENKTKECDTSVIFILELTSSLLFFFRFNGAGPKQKNKMKNMSYKEKRKKSNRESIEYFKSKLIESQYSLNWCTAFHVKKKADKTRLLSCSLSKLDVFLFTSTQHNNSLLLSLHVHIDSYTGDWLRKLVCIL